MDGFYLVWACERGRVLWYAGYDEWAYDKMGPVSCHCH